MTDEASSFLTDVKTLRDRARQHLSRDNDPATRVMPGAVYPRRLP